jgi:hypothetical protein
MASSGPVLGVNMIYSQLGKLAGNELKQLTYGQRISQTLQGWWNKLSNAEKEEGHYLAPSGPCPICALQAQANLNTLTALFEELENPEGPLWKAYRESDGICLAHLRLGLDHLASRFSQAAKRIAEDASQRLLKQSADMLEYIRKNNWEYRHEQIMPEESAAWRKTLTFFTGFPGAKFIFKMEDF